MERIAKIELIGGWGGEAQTEIPQEGFQEEVTLD
jgi:hypothetical protein